MIWWLLFQMGTQRTERMWKSENWSAWEEKKTARIVSCLHHNISTVLKTWVCVPTLRTSLFKVLIPPKRSVKVYLSVKPRILVRVADVHGESCGRDQLCDAVVNEPVRIGWLFHTVLETVKKTIKRRRWNTNVELIIEPNLKHRNGFNCTELRV